MIKAVHTVVWAFFVVCIVAIPVAAGRGEYRAATWLAAMVAVEVLVLAANDGHCPLTSVAGRFTDERRENFDIYLPVWLARYNRQVFGGLYAAGVLFAWVQWARAFK